MTENQNFRYSHKNKKFHVITQQLTKEMIDNLKRKLTADDETAEERLHNDIWVDELQGYKLIVIPNRKENGKLDPNTPTVTVKVIWQCPICGKPMGNPHMISLSEDKIDYTVSAWVNPCGHKVLYNQIQVAPGWELPAFYNKK